MIRNILNPAAVKAATPPKTLDPTLYILSSDHELKVGYTSHIHHLAQRLAHYQKKTLHTLSILYTCPGSRDIEQHLHAQLKLYRIFGSWYHNKPEVLAVIKQYIGRWLGPEPYHYNLNSMLLYFLNIIDYDQYDKNPLHERPIT